MRVEWSRGSPHRYAWEMRLAPLVLAYENHPGLLSLARLFARTTHGARAALEATEVLAWLLREALRGADLHPALKRVVEGGFLGGAGGRPGPRTRDPGRGPLGLRPGAGL